MYEEVSYKNPYLKSVVARIDFVAPLPGVEKALPSKLGRVFSDRFPIAEPNETFLQEFKLQLNPSGGDVERVRTPLRIWNFFGKDREKKLSFSSRFVFIEYTTYSSYEDLQANFGPVVNEIDSLFPDTRAARFGLRYVNDIAIEGVHPVNGWGDYISSDVFGVPALFGPETLTRLIHVAEMKRGDLALRFQFGLPNPDYPSPLKRPSFVLDFDAYIEAAHELKSSLQYADQAHECIQSLFEKSISENLREKMNVRPPRTV